MNKRHILQIIQIKMTEKVVPNKKKYNRKKSKKVKYEAYTN